MTTSEIRTSPKKSRKPNANTQLLWDAIASIARIPWEPGEEYAMKDPEAA